VRDGATSLPPAAVESVIAAMRRGEPWRRALESAAVAAGAEDALESIATEACWNWVWLTSFERRDVALDIGSVVSSMAPALSGHFGIVHHVESSPLLAEFAARRFAQDRLPNVIVSRSSPLALPFRDGSFDCVTVHGATASGPTAAGARASERLLSECRRVLRPAGQVYLALENPVWYARLADRSRRGAGEHAIARSIRAAGFEQLARYYAFPTFDRPHVVVPATRRATLAREIVEARGNIRRAVRIATAFLGLFAVLSPSLIIVGRK
jgi:SAM-dependent methyltransferase